MTYARIIEDGMTVIAIRTDIIIIGDDSDTMITGNLTTVESIFS
jgi:hypothetical protein